MEIVAGDISSGKFVTSRDHMLSIDQTAPQFHQIVVVKAKIRLTINAPCL